MQYISENVHAFRLCFDIYDYIDSLFNSLWPGKFNEILDEYFSSQLQWLMAGLPAVKLSLEKCH